MSIPESDPLQTAVVEARNSADRILADYLSGVRPKNPNDTQRHIIAFIESLSQTQKEEFGLVARFFTERALFKLIFCLEEGVSDQRFRLSSVREGVEQTHIGDEVEHDLIHAYWRWVAK